MEVLSTDIDGADATYVTIETKFGSIVAEIYTDKAPRTAGNFLAYVDRGLYQAAAFYRTVRAENDSRTPKIEVLQGGIDQGALHPPLGPIGHEPTHLTGLTHRDGALSAVRWTPGTTGSEFFIVIGDMPSLDHGGDRTADHEGFSVFGQVIEGMHIVRKIAAQPAGAATEFDFMRDQILLEPALFRAARFDRMRAGVASAARRAVPSQ